MAELLTEKVATIRPASPPRTPPSVSARGAGWSWRKGLAAPPPRFPPILPRATAGPVELSFGQQRLWLLAQFDAGSAAYHVPMAWRVNGPLDDAILERSLNQLIARHEALRTTFPAQEGEPRQVISPTASLELERMDFRHLAPAEREQELARQVRAFAQRAFELATGPVLRAALFRCATEEQVFVLVLHHIICDGPSIAVLLEELALYYRESIDQTPRPIPAPRVQYADFALWQREALDEALQATQLAYWREQLRDSPGTLDFPSDWPRPQNAGFRGAMEHRSLARELSDDFRALARQQGATRFMALLALFHLLLARHTGQEDIAVGCPMTHRTRAEVARVVGFFANMMVLRARLEGNPTFRELLQQTREVALGAYAHQDLPFEQLVAELKPERVPGRNPFFQAMLVVEESAWRRLALAGVQCAPLPVHNETAKFDLSLYAIDDPAGFRLSLEYNVGTIEPEVARDLLAHFENLLRAAVIDPNRPVFALPMLSARERETVLRLGYGTDEAIPADCFPALFETQTERTPDAIALRFGSAHLTYRELNLRANRLAHYLARQGAGAETLVAVSLERSPELVVALLAVMKSGAAYLPLDPANPFERQRATLQDSGAEILLGDHDFVTPVSCKMIRLDLADLTGESEANVAIRIQPESLAYVIYTSGSTGRPKGVEIEHRSLANFLASMRGRPGLSPNDILLAVTTVAFDIAGLELWLPLMVGATIVLAGREETTDAHRLMELLAKSGATVMQATPATWQMLLAVDWRGHPSLKILCGGESLSGALAEELLARAGAVWNLYGPTETTIWSSVHQVEARPGAVVAIGRPIANTSMYLLDRNREPVPRGGRGELYIGGAGVARGYRGMPQLTAERFVPDPFSTKAGARLYRTGDIARQRRDGTLEFLGRTDFQVKIRGYRIEPAEVEAILMRHPAVREATVQVPEDQSGERHLTGYIVAETEKCPGLGNDEMRDREEGCDPHTDSDLSTSRAGRELIAELRLFLQARLPNYMVPSSFVILPALPLTPNGKLDRKALPAVEHRPPEIALIKPSHEIEKRLKGIWENTVRAHPIGVTDNFFEIGGNSLLATRLLARVEREFGRRLALGTLFEAPTIRKLAAILRQGPLAASPLVQVQAGDPSVPPIFFVQARIGYRALAAELGAERPVYVVQYDDLLQEDPEGNLTYLAAELAQRIRRRQPRGPYLLGGMCLAGRVAFAIGRELYRQGEKVSLLAVIDMPAPGYKPLSQVNAWRRFVARVHWHFEYARRSDEEQKGDWFAGLFRAIDWQIRYRSWQCARAFFRRINRPLPRSLRHATRLMAEAAHHDPVSAYPGPITLFRPSEKITAQEPLDLGWGGIAQGGVEVCPVPGLKRSLLRTNATAVGRQLRKSLSQQHALTQDFHHP